jgi:23S rRNA (uracil1939-C5)-methyltransferase
MTSSPITLTIDRLSYGPAGVGRVDGKVVFVPGTAPGDEVEVVIDEDKKGYARGHVLTVTKPSPHRRIPPCPYVQRCGGCPWQHVAYDEQLRAKETLVREQLHRIGGMSDVPLLPIIPSPHEWHYRRRIRLRVVNNTLLGFSPPRSHEVVDIDSCVIAWQGVETHLRAAREWVRALRTPVSQLELTIGERVTSTREQQVICIAEARGALQREDEAVSQRFLASHSSMAGLLLRGKGWSRAWGESALSLNLGEETLVVHDGAFTQVNSKANRLLVESVLRLSDVDNTHRVIELYCGAGNFSLPLARRARELTGIEQDHRAVVAARANAARAGLTNARFMQATVQVGVKELCAQRVHGDVVLLDPPRTGAVEIMDEVSRLGARMIVYVSCDPATLARDLRRLHQHGYRLHAVQPLDMFPQTYHVETIAVSVLTC